MFKLIMGGSRFSVEYYKPQALPGVGRPKKGYAIHGMEAAGATNFLLARGVEIDGLLAAFVAHRDYGASIATFKQNGELAHVD